MGGGRQLSLDVFTFGEAMLRLSSPPGHPLELAPKFDVHVAGAEANVAVALAGLGRDVAWASKMPDSVLGRRVLGSLARAGVDCSYVKVDPAGRLGTYFVDLENPPRSTQITYDRANSLVCSYEPNDLPWDTVAESRVVFLSGISPALSEACLQTSHALATSVTGSESLFAIDINYRAKLWEASAAAEALTQLMKLADLVVCTREDAAELFQIDLIAAETAAALADRFGVPRVVVTDGARGAVWHEGGQVGHVASLEVDVIDRIGAGDAFTAGVIDGLLDGDLAEGVRRGVALAAISLTTVGDQVVVDRAGLDAVLSSNRRRVDR